MWGDFLADLSGRGLRAPLLGCSDGAPGLCGAFDRAFPNSLPPRCLIHRARNVLAKVSAHDQTDVMGGLDVEFHGTLQVESSAGRGVAEA